MHSGLCQAVLQAPHSLFAAASDVAVGGTLCPGWGNHDKRDGVSACTVGNNGRHQEGPPQRSSKARQVQLGDGMYYKYNVQNAAGHLSLVWGCRYYALEVQGMWRLSNKWSTRLSFRSSPPVSPGVAT